MIEGNFFNEIVLAVPFDYRILVLTALVLADTGVSVYLAVRARTFDWEKLPNFLWTGMTRKVLAYAGAHVLFTYQDALPGFTGAIPEAGLAATFTAVAIGLVVGIKRKILG